MTKALLERADQDARWLRHLADYGLTPCGAAADTLDSLAQSLREATELLATHPPYAADTTFAAIWQWLAKKDALLGTTEPAIPATEGVG